MVCRVWYTINSKPSWTTSNARYDLARMTLNDYIKEPRRNWDDKKWLQHAHVMVHSPWISEDDREYWRDKIKELSK